MKRHYINISILNLPDDINQTCMHLPDNINVSTESACNDLTCALLLTTLIRKVVETRPKAIELHEWMLANDYFSEVSIND